MFSFRGYLLCSISMKQIDCHFAFWSPQVHIGKKSKFLGGILLGLCCLWLSSQFSFWWMPSFQIQTGLVNGIATVISHKWLQRENSSKDSKLLNGAQSLGVRPGQDLGSNIFVGRKINLSSSIPESLANCCQHLSLKIDSTSPPPSALPGVKRPAPVWSQSNGTDEDQKITSACNCPMPSV